MHATSPLFTISSGVSVPTSGGCASTSLTLGTQHSFGLSSSSLVSSSPPLSALSSLVPLPTTPMTWWSNSFSPLPSASLTFISSSSSLRLHLPLWPLPLCLPRQDIYIFELKLHSLY
ncbi:hypothetical protein BHE74_00022628 [Ensete ventricosum]|nr:hypothetical protein GW17_00002082 [Ensete ventricosum]RWW69743.1 hypothetical protein BHE74_00022628 [Ensete ventricosum]RZR82024.1 hypothetical protein BHM03_00008363 [Ensete ventricosum]